MEKERERELSAGETRRGRKRGGGGRRRKGVPLARDRTLLRNGIMIFFSLSLSFSSLWKGRSGVPQKYSYLLALSVP